MAVERFSEQLFAERDRLILIHLVEAMRLEDILRRLDDEGRGVFVEAIDMSLEPAVLRLAEIEGEGIVAFVRAEPDETIGPDHHIGLEHIGIFCADTRIDAIGSNDQVGVGKLFIVHHLVLEDQLDAERQAAVLEDIEHALAADANKTMPGGADGPPLEQQFDIIPMVEGAFDLRRGLRIPLPHRLHGRIGKYHAPAECIERPVAFDDPNVVLRMQALHQEREIKACRPASDADNSHCALPSTWITIE